MHLPSRARKQAVQTGFIWLAPIHVSFLADLHSTRRRLYAGGAVGQAVHAATMIHKRSIVFDSALLTDPDEFRRIATHELFHFAWVRLGNPFRREWEGILNAESRRAARGELGWSAEWRKRELTTADRRRRSRPWREYACESFCDTAAWLFSGARPHAEATLAPGHALRRVEWFVTLFRTRGVAI